MKKLTEERFKKIVIQELRNLLESPRDYDHSSNMRAEENISLSGIKPGIFVQFPYQSESGDDRDRELFVIDPNRNGLIHGLDIGYMSERDIAKLFANIHANLSPMAAQMLDRTFPREFEAGPIGKSEDFYYDVVKGIPEAKQAYRTFRRDRIQGGLISKMSYSPTLSGDLQDYA